MLVNDAKELLIYQINKSCNLCTFTSFLIVKFIRLITIFLIGTKLVIFSRQTQIMLLYTIVFDK